MKYCAVCGNEIKSTKKRRCPYCNADLANPKNVVERDINIPISRITEENEDKKENTDDYEFEATEEDYFNMQLKTHKKWIAFLLQLFLGPFGASFFYIGRWLRGIIWLVLNVLLGLAYFAFQYTAFYIIIAVNVIMAICVLFVKQTDANGLELE